jgi:hypothetical protein
MNAAGIGVGVWSSRYKPIFDGECPLDRFAMLEDPSSDVCSQIFRMSLYLGITTATKAIYHLLSGYRLFPDRNVCTCIVHPVTRDTSGFHVGDRQICACDEMGRCFYPDSFNSRTFSDCEVVGRRNNRARFKN